MSNPKLLLHICCAPCSPNAIAFLREDFDPTAYFYDPNIHPEDEYLFRLDEMRRLSSLLNIPFISAEYDSDRWFELTKGHENDREGEGRCGICFRMRLKQAAIFARDNGFEYFTTVLTTGPRKDAVVINRIGKELAGEYGIKFYEADFKKKDGFKISVQKSKEYGLKRQNYCGCVFSRKNLPQTFTD